MYPTIHFLNLSISSYILLVGIGFSFGSFITDKFSYLWDIQKKKAYYMVLAAEIGTIIGGKILFLLTSISKLPYLFSKYGIFTLIKTGFVFYGGLIGASLFVIVYAKLKKENVNNFLCLMFFATPLVHFFGRLGCLFSGCCYGIEYKGPLSINLNGIDRFPVQLLEASLNLMLFFGFIFFRNRSCLKRNIISIYLISYGAFRLITESLRGDLHRGFVGWISISTVISLLCISLGVILLMRKIYFNKVTVEGTISTELSSSSTLNAQPLQSPDDPLE